MWSMGCGQATDDLRGLWSIPGCCGSDRVVLSGRLLVGADVHRTPYYQTLVGRPLSQSVQALSQLARNTHF